MMSNSYGSDMERKVRGVSAAHILPKKGLEPSQRCHR